MLKISNDIHFEGIRPEKEIIDKIDALGDFLRENNLLLLYGKYHIEIKDRKTLKPIATAFIL